MYASDKRRIAPLSLVLGVMLAAACGGGEKPAIGGAIDTSAAVTATAATCPGGNAGITLPSGFCATVFADSVEHGRNVVVASNGDVYVTLEGTTPSKKKQASGVAKSERKASFVAMRDTNHDGRADMIQRVGSLGNTGIGIANGYLYVDEGKRIVRYARPDSQLAPTARAEVIVDGIPLDPGHRARNFVIANDGALYVNVGSSTNTCQQKDRAKESPGKDPCPELATRAGIWRFAANKTNQHFSPAARYATGIRNGMGLAFGSDGKLYATQHGRDNLNDNWPAIFPTTKYSAENPAEELLQVNQGDDFGWPYCFYSVSEKKLVDAPEYGGDGTKSARCQDKKGPIATFPGHWAPMSLLFYSGSAFPARYRNGAFIAFHGSWNRAPEPQEGYRVVFQPMSNGEANGAYETFANDFAGLAPDQIQPGMAKHRPTGLAQGPDGTLYLTDDLGGRVYRITYGAPK